MKLRTFNQGRGQAVALETDLRHQRPEKNPESGERDYPRPGPPFDPIVWSSGSAMAGEVVTLFPPADSGNRVVEHSIGPCVGGLGTAGSTIHNPARWNASEPSTLSGVQTSSQMYQLRLWPPGE